MLSILLIFGSACSKTPDSWWYPFVSNFFAGYYSTGPLAMTSNTREDNPIWEEMAAFNKMQARLTYAMSRGEPRSQIAWLFPQAEWVDAPAMRVRNFTPNEDESDVSRALREAGFSYDRISRSDLESAQVRGENVVIGKAEYDAILITDLRKADPRLLENAAVLAARGIPLLLLGDEPTRATGWANHLQRDAAVEEANASLRRTAVQLETAQEIAAALETSGLNSALATSNSSSFPFRILQRSIQGGELLLLFNDSQKDITQKVQIHLRHESVQLLDPETGEARVLVSREGEVEVPVPARRIRILHLSDPLHERKKRNEAKESRWESEKWQNPPRALHPFIRWWWPGDDVDPDELRAELASLHKAGYGGVEIQTLTIGFPFEHLEAREEQIYGVGTPSFFGHLKTAFDEAEKLGLTVDLTLGSGWSSGGPFIDGYPEQQLIQSFVDVSGPASLDIELPEAKEPGYVRPSNWVIKGTIGAFDSNARLHAVVAARIEPRSSPETLTELVDITQRVIQGKIKWEVPPGKHRIFAIYQNGTSHNVVASAYPTALDASPALDHLNRAGVQEYIDELGEPWLAAIAPYKPHAFFVDSFELIGELPWSTPFHQAFVDLHGYDPTPYLPLFFKARGESKYVNVIISAKPAYRSVDDMAERVREDYELVREQLFADEFLAHLKAWTEKKGVKLRLQAHGGYGDYLDSYKIADIPESEALFGGGTYEFLKLASSAAHIAGRRMVTSESFINLTLDHDALELESYYLLAGNAFAAGINRTICHGYAYHYPLYSE